jgi:uncharacterized protein (TIGR02001 family)
MKKLLLAVSVLACALSTVNAQSTNPPFTVTLSSVVANKYLNQLGFELYDKPVVQSDLFISHRSGFYIDLWHSTGFDTRLNNNLGDEIDYGAGWNGTLGKYFLHIGMNYFDEPNLFTFGRGDIIYTHVRIGREVGFVTLTVGYENFSTFPGTDFEGGNLFSLTANKDVSWWNNRLTTSASVAGVYDDGCCGLDDGFFLKGSVAFIWNVNEHLSFTLPGVYYVLPLTINDVRTTDAMLSVGLTYKF